ncbi:MAG TPA: dihydrolipoyllysine-residue succinyltransferase [Rhabdochlamydiaceae bacterium]|nr:dihydrolipoyllysine-residue succinyltransferase [Rhabdochlamydiaceae bacterium]
MKVEIKVPSAGESVTEATVSKLLKENGSYVKVDEEILELETEKVNQVVYAPAAGQLTWNVKTEQTVKVGQVIGTVETDAKAPTEQPPKEKPQEKPKEKPAAAPPSAPIPKKPEGPSARKMAAEYVAEIQKPKAAAPQVKREEGAKGERKKMSRLRKTIADRLVSVKNETAMLTTFNEADLTNMMAMRAKEQENFVKKYGIKLGFMSFFVKAAVAALKAYPEVNAAIDGDDIITFQTYDISIAVSTERGLMVPVVRGCDQMSFGEIEGAIAAFSKKAREGTISIEDLKGGSFTITNGGVFGSLLSTPILNPPQSAILGMHAIQKRPVVVSDQIVIRPMMYLALSYDHRVIDGKEAVLFLVHIKESLEDPSRLLLEL